MSAYTNPETYIDTQSAQHLQNLQSTIAGSFAKVAESYASRQAEIKKQNAINEKENQQLEIDKANYTLGQYDKLTELAKADSSINWNTAFSPLIDEGANLNLAIANRTSKSPQKDILKVSKIKAAIPQAANVFGKLSGEGTTLDESMAIGLGKQGGIYSASDPKTLRFMGILQKKLPGERDYGFKDNDPELPFITAKTNDPLYGDIAYNVNILEKIMDGTSDLIITVPDQRPKFDVAKTTSANIFESQDIVRDKATVKLPNGRVTNDFLMKDQKTKTIKLREENIIDAGQNKVTKFVADVNIAEIRADRQLNANLKAQADALQTNDLQFKAYMNDIVIKDLNRINKNDVLQAYDMKTPLTDAQKTESIELYKDHFFKTQIPLTQDVVDPDSNLYTKTYEPEKPKAEGDGKESKKKESIESIVRRIGDVQIGDLADFTYNGRKVAYDGGNFIIERTAGLKDLVFEKKKDVINYLKTGGTSKPKLKGK